MALIKLYLEPKISKCSLSWICPVFSYVLEQVSNVIMSEKNGLSLYLQVRNKQCLQPGGSSLSSGHENRASLCQQLFLLVDFWAAES